MTRRKVLSYLRPWEGLIRSPIVIYSMGKVGSSTVYNSLQNAGLMHPIFHVHFMDWENLREVEPVLQQSQPTVPSHIVAGKGLRFFADRTWGLLRWKIITLVREPVSREISDFFENLHRNEILLDLEGDCFIAEASKMLTDQLSKFDEETDYACNWFDRELKAVFNMDVYSTPFDHEKGFATYHADHADILLIRLKDLTTHGRRALEEFLGVPDIQFEITNTGTEKIGSKAYSHVKRNVRLPKEILKKIYASRYANHFYSANEINEFTHLWSLENAQV